MTLRDVTYSDVRHCLQSAHAIKYLHEGTEGDVVYRVTGTCLAGNPLEIPVVLTEDDNLVIVTVIRPERS